MASTPFHWRGRGYEESMNSGDPSFGDFAAPNTYAGPTLPVAGQHYPAEETLPTSWNWKRGVEEYPLWEESPPSPPTAAAFSAPPRPPPSGSLPFQRQPPPRHPANGPGSHIGSPQSEHSQASNNQGHFSEHRSQSSSNSANGQTSSTNSETQSWSSWHAQQFRVQPLQIRAALSTMNAFPTLLCPQCLPLMHWKVWPMCHEADLSAYENIRGENLPGWRYHLNLEDQQNPCTISDLIRSTAFATAIGTFNDTWCCLLFIWKRSRLIQILSVALVRCRSVLLSGRPGLHFVRGSPRADDAVESTSSYSSEETL